MPRRHPFRLTAPHPPSPPPPRRRHGGRDAPAPIPAARRGGLQDPLRGIPRAAERRPGQRGDGTTRNAAIIVSGRTMPWPFRPYHDDRVRVSRGEGSRSARRLRLDSDSWTRCQHPSHSHARPGARHWGARRIPRAGPRETAQPRRARLRRERLGVIVISTSSSSAIHRPAGCLSALRDTGTGVGGDP